MSWLPSPSTSKQTPPFDDVAIPGFVGHAPVPNQGRAYHAETEDEISCRRVFVHAAEGNARLFTRGGRNGKGASGAGRALPLNLLVSKQIGWGGSPAGGEGDAFSKITAIHLIGHW
jgi:hypothetical protein